MAVEVVVLVLVVVEFALLRGFLGSFESTSPREFPGTTGGCLMAAAAAAAVVLLVAVVVVVEREGRGAGAGAGE